MESGDTNINQMGDNMKTVYAVYARFNSRPAGFAGYFMTKNDAERFANEKRRFLPHIVKRELVDCEQYDKIKTMREQNER